MKLENQKQRFLVALFVSRTSIYECQLGIEITKM